MDLVVGDVWFAKFPLEENPSESINRPVVVLDIDTVEVLSVKVTKTAPRNTDEFDLPIVYWEEANLRFKSTARVAKTVTLPKSAFINRIGTLHPDDLTDIQTKFIEYIDSLDDI
ncbi:type II toxin-antitoxin system PemK/MazF family toxin [Brevibacillus laterosporus]|uniref:type II toxin-antitoxin system PemK/MazF family toxin n=1 Tax=Brevibacillus laterosporus TaxID=1465 RepID=UPI000839C937|nr:type II toxin-antitoxin system PemK/MazF family toxin [Brevibacillus laterosporus]